MAIKVFGERTSETELKLQKLLKPSTHPGKQYAEIALDSFMVHGPNGHHFCKVLEPLGGSLKAVLDSAFDIRCDLNDPENWLGRALEGVGETTLERRTQISRMIF